MSSPLHQAIKSGALRDGVTPYSNVEPLTAAKQVLENKYVFPYVGELPVWANGTLQWKPDFGNNQASKALWFYSLVFIDYLVKAAVVENNEHCWQKALQLHKSYQQWREDDQTATAFLFKDEHAVTNRACVLSQLLHVVTHRVEQGEPLQLLQQQLLQDLSEHANWLEQDKHYVFNNHGIMMDRALLNLVVQFRQHAVEYSRYQSEQWLVKALSRIKIMLDRTFDNGGCCTENSPSYHMLNLSLFGAINSFINKHELVAKDNAITAVLKKAIAAAAYQVYEDGSLPLIGDSETNASVFVSDTYHKNKFGVGYFPEAGFCIVKQPGFHFTFKCGGSSFSHRHNDDTSITLRVDGLDFICDGGMYSYDNSNDIRRFLTSYKAHSGFFTENCANVRYSNYAAADELARMNTMDNHGKIIHMSGDSFLDPNVGLKRQITLLGEQENQFNKVLLCDRLKADQAAQWRLQFLLHPDVVVTQVGEQVKLQRQHVYLLLSFNSTSAVALNIEPGHYSERYQQVQPCKVLVLTGLDPKLEINTLITIHQGPKHD
ncbi:heparinase II/III family protein [Rheinheimera baltica]|uniref:heparinase II/III domain-containing protein n=1 Tax=Rheinheimera baltica TaxID=67576 RepID=UPI00273D4AF0|nr:heparinase II/III family protein [Rheinheimera baltica]MDP5143050.1 heparinase II/III family protein [Rheinheimera baltica]